MGLLLSHARTFAPRWLVWGRWWGRRQGRGVKVCSLPESSIRISAALWPQPSCSWPCVKLPDSKLTAGHGATSCHFFQSKTPVDANEFNKVCNGCLSDSGRQFDVSHCFSYILFHIFNSFCRKYGVLIAALCCRWFYQYVVKSSSADMPVVVYSEAILLLQVFLTIT